MDMDTLDRAAVTLGIGLMTVGIAVLGLVETLTGKPFNPTPVTNDAGAVVAAPTVDPALRTGLVVAGLLVLGAWGLYRVAGSEVPAGEQADTGTTAD
jgi:hypothetical protein